MAEIGWLQVIGLALGSGFTVKLLDIGYREFSQRRSRSQSATRFVDEHLDPLLKAADELTGKLQSLGREDFRPLRKLNDQTKLQDNKDLAGLMYLFARFWAHIEIIRIEGLSVALAEDSRGGRLQKFIDCLESRHIRLIDRTSQRAIGETSLARSGDKLEAASFIAFVEQTANCRATKQWVEPLRAIIVRGWHQSRRQKLLQYSVVLHAMLDTLDPEHVVTRDRPPTPKKLSRQSWRDLHYRVFGQYLTFVPNHQKYLGPRKKDGPRSL